MGFKKFKSRRRTYGGYKKFRSPAIFSGGKVKEKKQIKIPKISYKLVLLLIVIALVLYYMFASGNFIISEVMVKGNNMISTEAIASEIPKGKNIFLLSSNTIEKKIKAANPEIQTVQVIKGIPNAIKVVVFEHDCKMIWQSGEKSYLISTQGMVAKEIKEGETYNYPKVIDKKGISVEIGSGLLSPNFIAFINNIHSQFKEATNISPLHFEVEETTFDVNLFTEAGFYVKLNTMRSSAKQLENLKKVLVEKRNDVHEYVDLRIDGWAYYK